MAIKRLAITVSGRVHGVGFRFFSRDAADRLGLTGWVRNTHNKTVELEAQGEETLLNFLCEKVRHGPSLAHVDGVTIKEIPVRANETSFDIFH